MATNRSSTLRAARILDRVLLVVMLLGVLLGAIWAAFAMARGTLDPFPAYGANLRRVDQWMFPVLAGLWIVWAFAAWQRSKATRSFLLREYVIALVFTTLAGLLWLFGLDLLNAALDFGPHVVTPIYVQRLRETSTSGPRFGRTTIETARVNRLDRPKESVVIDWSLCRLGPWAETSPYATITLSAGAFGTPWFSNLKCRALIAGDRPLFGDFVIGQGRPLVLITVGTWGEPPSGALDHSDEERELVASLERLASAPRRRARAEAEEASLYAGVLPDEERVALRKILAPLEEDESAERGPEIGAQALTYVRTTLRGRDRAAVLRSWLDALQRTGIPMTIALVREGSERAPVAGVTCAACRVLLKPDLDEPILRTVADWDDLWSSDTKILVLDGNGRKLFTGSVFDEAAIPRVTAQLAPAARSTSPSGP
jgi:hypothetical protein